MNVLLSIKPKYVDQIAKGSKKYEFRKSLFKRKDINAVYIYSTSPIKKIVGKFTLGEVIRDKPENLWRKFKRSSGISREEFFIYFYAKKEGFAIELESVEFFKTALDPEASIWNFSPPQSFCYFNDDLVKDLESRCAIC